MGKNREILTLSPLAANNQCPLSPPVTFHHFHHQCPPALSTHSNADWALSSCSSPLPFTSSTDWPPSASFSRGAHTLATVHLLESRLGAVQLFLSTIHKLNR